MAVRQAPTSVVQNVISALVEDPAELKRAAAAASAAAALPAADASDAVDSLPEDVPAVAQLDADELLKQAEEQAGDQFQGLLDSKGLKRLVTSFERKYKENLEMRTRYADQPEKFMESELDLDEEVKKLMAIAGSPELYPDFVRTNTVGTLLSLLTHQNTDIVADVIGVFEDLTDADVIEDSEEEAQQLVDSMLQHDALSQLVYRLRHFNETVPEEAEAVQKLLNVFENMIEVRPAVAEQLVQLGDNKTGFLRWVLDRLKNVKEFEGNKQYVSELLSILMQSSTANQLKLAAMNGIDALLSCVFPYKGRNARSDGEEEYVANLFGCLCSCLMPAENKLKFMQAEGLELMQLILKERRIARLGSLKVLDFATTRCTPACERWVELTGLKQLFAIFMGKSKMKHRKGEENIEQEEEEHTLSVISNLFQGLSRGSRRDRVAAKFVENEFEKCDRLMELYNRYRVKVVAEQAVLEQLVAEEGLSEEEVLLRRMEAGLYGLQMCALIIGNLWIVGDQGVKERLVMLLHQQSNTMGEVRDVLRELRLTVGDEGDLGDRERQQARIKRMLLGLGLPEEELDAEMKAHKQQQEAAAAAVPEGLQPNGDAHMGVAGGIPQQEGMPAMANGQADGDVEMQVDGVTDVDMSIDPAPAAEEAPVPQEQPDLPEELPPLPPTETLPAEGDSIKHRQKHKRKHHDQAEATEEMPVSRRSRTEHTEEVPTSRRSRDAQTDVRRNHEADVGQDDTEGVRHKDRETDGVKESSKHQHRSEHRHRHRESEPDGPKEKSREHHKDRSRSESHKHRDRDSSKRHQDEDVSGRHHSGRSRDKDDDRSSSRRHRHAEDRHHRSRH